MPGSLGTGRSTQALRAHSLHQDSSHPGVQTCFLRSSLTPASENKSFQSLIKNHTCMLHVPEQWLCRVGIPRGSQLLDPSTLQCSGVSVVLIFSQLTLIHSFTYSFNTDRVPAAGQAPGGPAGEQKKFLQSQEKPLPSRSMWSRRGRH